MLSKKSLNHRLLIKQLYFGGQLTCAELSEKSQKSIPFIIKEINELIKVGIVKENGLSLSTGGRRAQNYSLNIHLQYIISVAIDQLITRIAVLDFNNNFIGKTIQLDLNLSNRSDALSVIISAINDVISQSEIPKSKFIGIGIGMPGFVDVTKGINHSFLKTIPGQNIVQIIEGTIGIPVLIDNDSSLIALSELKLGKIRNKQNAMVVNIGWGIGLGIIVNGQLIRGNNGFAGEFSHIPLFNNNIMCSCGKNGCLETETSLLVITKKAIQGLKDGQSSLLTLENLQLNNPESTSNSIIEAAIAGDKFAIELISTAGYFIGKGIAILIHLLNPELIILSGRGAKAGKLWLTPIQQAIHEHSIPKIAENTTIEISLLNHHAELIGAAALVMEHYEFLDAQLPPIIAQKKKRNIKSTKTFIN